MNTPKDAAGRSLTVGDTVMGTYGGYSGLTRMTVTGFTPKSIRCESVSRLQGASGRGGMVGSGEQVIRSAHQIVLVATGDGTTIESRGAMPRN